MIILQCWYLGSSSTGKGSFEEVLPIVVVILVLVVAATVLETVVFVVEVLYVLVVVAEAKVVAPLHISPEY